MIKIRLTLITSSLTCGGAEKNVALLANTFAKSGADVTVISFDRHPPFFKLEPPARLMSTDITRGYRNIFQDFWTTPSRLIKLRRAIKETLPEVVISFMDINNLLTILATRFLHVPVIVAERSDPAIWPKQWGWRRLRSILYPCADRIITQTETAKQFFSQSLQSKIMVIPNPVPAMDNISSASDKQREKIILGIGRLTQIKRFDVLLRAMAKIHGEYPDWKVDILGEGEEHKTLESLSRELGLADVVRWHGLTQETHPYLRDAAIFVLCSEFEGFPNALSEALAAGIPAIASATLGAKALIEPGVNGHLVPIASVDHLANALRELISSPEKRAAMGAKAKDVTRKFSLNRVVQQWENVVLEVK